MTVLLCYLSGDDIVATAMLGSLAACDGELANGRQGRGLTYGDGTWGSGETDF